MYKKNKIGFTHVIILVLLYFNNNNNTYSLLNYQPL